MSESRIITSIDPKDREKPLWVRARRVLRVMLIQPPASGGVSTLLPHFQEDEGIGHKPPLGLLYIAAYLKAHAPHEIRVLDAQPKNYSPEEIVRQVRQFKPDLVGVSAWTELWYPAYRTGELIKQALPETHLVYGGPHVSIYPEDTLALPFVDSVIVGDGEVPFFYLANMLSNDVRDASCPGLHFAEHGVKAHPEKFHIQKDLDALPFPDRTMLPLDDYDSVLGREARVTTMITSRGCPNACIFCKLNFQKTLCRSADNVIREFMAIQALGFKEVELYDDTFTWSKERVRAICEGLLREECTLKWAIRDRVSNASDELLALMRKAGCTRVHYGIESGVDRMLQVIRKKITVDQAERAVALAKKHGYVVLVYFMFGNPTETVEEMRQSIGLALKLKADFCEFSIAIPYPGTQMYEDALRDGSIRKDYWREYALSPVSGFQIPCLIETHASRGELIAILEEAYRRFYFRPAYIMRKILELRSPGEFKRKAAMALSLFRKTVLPFFGLQTDGRKP